MQRFYTVTVPATIKRHYIVKIQTRKKVVIRNNRYNAYELQKIKEEVAKKSNTDENSLQKQNHKR